MFTATFFIVGENGQANPDLIKRIVAEGHEIGNHSFTHPNLGEVPRRVTDLEIKRDAATDRIFDRTLDAAFSRAVFRRCRTAHADEVEPTVQAQKLGYITVGLHLDPDDWKLKNDDGTRAHGG